MENDSQITACDAEVLRYFRKHGPAPAVSYCSIIRNCLTNNTVNTDVSRLVAIDSTT